VRPFCRKPFQHGCPFGPTISKPDTRICRKPCRHGCPLGLCFGVARTKSKLSQTIPAWIFFRTMTTHEIVKMPNGSQTVPVYTPHSSLIYCNRTPGLSKSGVKRNFLDNPICLSLAQASSASRCPRAYPRFSFNEESQ
jgi:hypothetical protein